ncbi:MAG: hypothetical protein AAGC64_13795 [Bacteroidota bacterium]
MQRILVENDPSYEYQFDSEIFIQKLIEKYQVIRTIDSNAILYIINLFSEDSRKPDFISAKGEKLSKKANSCIRIIPSVLTPENENLVSSHFQLLLEEIHSKYATA